MPLPEGIQLRGHSSAHVAACHGELLHKDEAVVLFLFLLLVTLLMCLRRAGWGGWCDDAQASCLNYGGGVLHILTLDSRS